MARAVMRGDGGEDEYYSHSHDWVPAWKVEGSQEYEQRGFLTYGVLLNDCAACLLTPHCDLGTLRIYPYMNEKNE